MTLCIHSVSIVFDYICCGAGGRIFACGRSRRGSHSANHPDEQDVGAKCRHGHSFPSTLRVAPLENHPRKKYWEEDMDVWNTRKSPTGFPVIAFPSSVGNREVITRTLGEARRFRFGHRNLHEEYGVLHMSACQPFPGHVHAYTDGSGMDI
jgi:hypothetical protein